MLSKMTNEVQHDAFIIVYHIDDCSYMTQTGVPQWVGCDIRSPLHRIGV
jgi:hypothetical protein